MKRKGLAPDERTYTSLIHLFCDQGQCDRAHKALSEMIDSGFSPSVDTYNRLIRASSVEDAVEILRGMTERGLSPDAVSYSIVILKCCIVEEPPELEKALEMKAEMVDKGILPDADTYSLLMKGLFQEGRLSEALDLLREMLRGGVSPDKGTDTGLMKGYCLEGEFSKAFHLHDEMIMSDVVTLFSPSLVTYNALIHGYCFLGRVEEALEILRGMPEMGLSPNSVSYLTVISGFCKIGEPGKAYELKVEMDEKCMWLDKHTYNSLMEDLSVEDTYSSLMNDYCAEGNMEKAYKLQYEMDHDGYLPASVNLSVFLNALTTKARTSEAKEYLMSTISSQCLHMPTYITYDTLIEDCSNNEFKSVVGLVKGFLMRDLVNEAARAHDTMLHGNFKPDGAVYNLLIFDHCRSDNVRKAYNMYMEMVHFGFGPHIFSVLALINALYYEERYGEMRWVIQNTLRSCNLNDSELHKVLDEIDVTECEINALLDVLAEIAMDGLLLDGGKCSYASAST